MRKTCMTIVALASMALPVESAPMIRNGVFCNELAQMKNVLHNATMMPLPVVMQIVNAEKVVCVWHRVGAIIEKPVLVFEEKMGGRTFHFYKADMIGIFHSDGSITEITPPVTQYLVSQDKFDPKEQVGGV